MSVSCILRGLYVSFEVACCLSAEWYAQQDPSRFVCHTGEAVVSIDVKAHTVTTDKDRMIHYDYCVLATGSEATLPDYVDRNVKGVFVYRNISDLNNMLEYSNCDSVRGTPVRLSTRSLSLFIQLKTSGYRDWWRTTGIGSRKSVVRP